MRILDDFSWQSLFLSKELNASLQTASVKQTFLAPPVKEDGVDVLAGNKTSFFFKLGQGFLSYT